MERNFIRPGGDLFDVYKKPSLKKQAAWERIKEDCRSLNGYDLNAHNDSWQFFSAGFLYEDESGETWRRGYSARGSWEQHMARCDECGELHVENGLYDDGHGKRLCWLCDLHRRATEEKGELK